MKLSEAIRLGAMLRPQGYGYLFAYGKTCALGAAAEAIGIYRECAEAICIHDPVAADRSLRAVWPMLESVVFDERLGRMPLRGAIMIRNDSREWTRERIADWVEQFEAVEEPSTAQPESVTA